MLVAVGSAKVDSLRDALDDDAEMVTFVDMQVLGRNPARIIPAWRDFLSGRSDEGVRVRGIGEPIWPSRTAAELVEAQCHEALLNIAFADSGRWDLLCPYDIEACRTTS